MIKKILMFCILWLINISITNATDIDGFRFTLSGSSLVVSDYSDNIIDSEPTDLTLETFQIFKYNNKYYIGLEGYYYPTSIRYKHTFISFDGTSLTEINIGTYEQNSFVVSNVVKFAQDSTNIYFGMSLYDTGTQFYATLIINKSTGIASEQGINSFGYSPFDTWTVDPNRPLYYIGGSITDNPENIISFIPGLIFQDDNFVFFPDIEANRDYYLNIDIYRAINNEYVYQKNINLGSFSGTLNNIAVGYAPTIYKSDYQFNLFNYYRLVLNYTNYDIPTDTGSFEYDMYFNPTGIEVNITEESFTFSVDKVNKLDNGFSIDGFQVYPNCGNVTFDIVGPNAAGTGTMEILAGPFFCNAQDPVNGYGSGKTVTVTYPYHEYPGQYSFVMKYTWGEYTIYPFGTGAINYFITAPRQLGDTGYTEDGVAYDDSIWDFDKNGDGEITISEFFSGLAAIPGYYLRKIYSYFGELIKIVKKFSGFATMEETNWTSFIYSTTYAESESLGGVWERDLDTVGYDDTVLGHISTFLMGFIYFILFVIGVVVFIYLAKKK